MIGSWLVNNTDKWNAIEGIMIFLFMKELAKLILKSTYL